MGLLAGTVACTQPDAGEAGGAPLGGPAAAQQVVGGSLAVLQVERMSDVRAEDLSTASLTAAFAHYRGLEGEQVAELLGSALPSELGECHWVEGALEDDVLSEAEVDLLDGGSIEFKAGFTETRLRPRTFPELGGVAAGVFYAEDAALGSVRPDMDSYRFEVEGREEVAAFTASIPAPADPADVVVAGVPADELPVLSRAEDAEVRWEPGQSRDLMEIELRAEGETLRCVARDEGMLRIPAALLELASGSGSQGLLARRVRVQSFDAPGFDLAYVRVTAALAFDIVLN